MKKTLDLGELHRSLPSTDACLALLAFEKEGDLVKAAKSLQLTQPAISFHLKKIENQMGFQLFSTSGKRKILTKAGQEYVQFLKEVFRDWYRAHDQVLKESERLDQQKLRVSGRRELLIPFLSFPFQGQIEFIQSSSSEALDALRDHRVDLAVSAHTIDSGDLVSKLFFESGLKLVVPKRWKFDMKNERDLRNLPVVVYGNHHAYLDEYLSHRGIAFKSLKVSRVVEDWFSVVELVKEGFGWAITPEAWGIHTDEVQSFSFPEGALAKQKIFLFHRREDRKLPWVLKLEKWLKEQ